MFISDSPPLCLGCLASANCKFFCTKCSWPVCNAQCESLPAHKDNECKVFAEAKVKFQAIEDCKLVCLQYECITPLRVLLAKEKNPERWSEEVELMESHDDIRKTKPIWQFNQINVVQYLRTVGKLDRFSEELIHRVCGILEVNAFEARAASGSMVRCLFPKLAILSHNCVSNIYHSVSPHGFNVVVKASVEVPENSQLYSSYTFALWPTLVRREFLKESKFFECKCSRCRDPTELGTHMSSLKCNNCENGTIISREPLNFDSDWKCSNCDYSTTAQTVRKIYEVIQEELDAVEWLADVKAIEQRELIFKKYQSILHPKNAYMTILRTALTQLYGRIQGYGLNNLSNLLLERKIELCNTLLEVLDIVEPGLSRIRGVTLYELHAPLMVLAKNLYNSNAISKELFRKKMEEALETLHKSVKILRHELPGTNEKQLGDVAKQAYHGLKRKLEKLIETAQKNKKN